ncbi:MAG: hypothetical protein ACTSRK_18245, partial [Promethearchaeota archaeon]
PLSAITAAETDLLYEEITTTSHWEYFEVRFPKIDPAKEIRYPVNQDRCPVDPNRRPVDPDKRPVNPGVLPPIYFVPEQNTIKSDFLPIFRQFVTHIAAITPDTWRTYYALHPIDLARMYIKFGADPTITAPLDAKYDLKASPTLHPEIYNDSNPIKRMQRETNRPITLEERIRLLHEADYRIFHFMQEHLPSDDPVLQKLSERFRIQNTGTNPHSESIYL